MDQLVEFRTEDGALVVVEGAGVTPRPGTRLVSRGDEVVRAAATFEGALDGVRAAAEAALRVFRDGALRPDAVEIEFGVKMSAEAGAIIAKGSAEGQLVVKLHWKPGSSAGDALPAVPDQAAAGPESAERP
ncbi:CU044_2847 family protein [Streptomyces sp. NPDC094031]|uniref:CU044_2847 family protein n=1 Tax=Streptomyces sp. NPDC094031 TaxID=3155307 RepID=UPI00332C26DB